MLPDKELKLVHFQLTRNCNLRCWFCGQWGRKGFFSNASGEPMSFDNWKNVIDTLIAYRKKSGVNPAVMLWGGEPLMYPGFDKISEYLRVNNFELGMVTNGVLIDRHTDTLKRCFDKIYVSVDGTEKVHDSIRGEGVFKKVCHNLKLLEGGSAEIVIMTVLSEAVLSELDILPETLLPLNPSQLLLQEMIYMTEEEIAAYAAWFEKCFERKPTEIYSWQMKPDSDFIARKADALKKVMSKKYPFEVKYMPHGEMTGQPYCRSPFNHAHVAWNGNVLYCTDFYDFNAGNVKNDSIINIFNNELSEKFRSEVILGNCLTCNHCSWRNNTEFNL